MVLTCGDLAVAYHESVKHDRLSSFFPLTPVNVDVVVRFFSYRGSYGIIPYEK